MRKKTFIIKNETSIPTNFWLSIKNFYPIRCVCEWKSKKDLIKSIYKRVFGQKKGLVGNILFIYEIIKLIRDYYFLFLQKKHYIKQNNLDQV